MALLANVTMHQHMQPKLKLCETQNVSRELHGVLAHHIWHSRQLANYEYLVKYTKANQDKCRCANL